MSLFVGIVVIVVAVVIVVVVFIVIVVVILIVVVVMVMTSNHNIHNLGLSCFFTTLGCFPLQTQVASLFQSVQSDEIYDVDLMVLEVL